MKGMDIRIKRIKRGLTQAQLAKELGVSQTDISKLERGIYKTLPSTSRKLIEIFSRLLLT